MHAFGCQTVARADVKHFSTERGDLDQRLEQHFIDLPQPQHAHGRGQVPGEA
jgi:hypothetical protein